MDRRRGTIARFPPILGLATALVAAACAGGEPGGPAAPPPEPRIAGLDPVEGRAGAEVRILGEGFGSDPAAIGVTFGGESAALVEARDTSVRVAVPAIDPGQVDVVVTVGGRASNPGVFRVLEPPVIQPPVGSLGGSWRRTLLRTAADGACPDPLPEREVVELRIESSELVLGEASGDVQLDGTWRASGSVHFDDGSSIRVTIEARFTIENGRLAIVGELVREHLAADGSTTCTESYDLRLNRV